MRPFVTALLIFTLLLQASCGTDAADKIRAKRLKVELSAKKLKRTGTLVTEIREESPIDSLKFEGAEPVEISPDRKRLTYRFERTGKQSIGIKAYTAEGPKQHSSIVKVTALQPARQLSFEVVETLPHDPGSYTQGLEFYKGNLYESKGQYGESGLVKRSFPEMKTLAEAALEREYFGEGLTVVNDTIYQLTWRQKLCFLYDLSLNRIDQRAVPTAEGWGLCHDHDYFYLSDGTAFLYRLDRDFSVQDRQEIYDGDRPLDELNELEFVKGRVVANVYRSNRVYFIDPGTGEATSFLDFSSLRSHLSSPEAEVMNGIAWLPERNLYLVTGKYWDKAFLVKVEEEEGPEL